jgi:hypothetical protein
MKILTGNEVIIQHISPEKYKTIIQAVAEKHTEFHGTSLKKTEVLEQSSGECTTPQIQGKSSLK